MIASPNRARDLFLTAVRLAPDQWDAFLAAECGEDEALRGRVRGLLAAHKEAGSFLEPVAGLVATTDEPAGERPGTVIGPYKLLEQIGEGGFGTVYMAEQSEPVRRKVALKVLKPGMDSRQGVARFEAERQALAIMDHPNIAKVFDGGQTPAGRLYFVMELVKGTPITQFCDEQKLSPRQRLELFLSVCQAVQHAHQKGIIHRDLKPSNVLVTMHDATPVVKVIDFGVAKALGQSLTDKTLFTGFAQMIGTPLYMSPEQAGQSGLDVDTRSDIYSLGVLLYELLTGTTPFDKERFKQAAFDEIRRIIREEEPPKPSTRLSESKDALPSVAAQRQIEPAKLTRLVRGELDWIVMKALEKDRSRRYETANGFAMDLQRYLADEAVLACPPSAGYRLRKFARRNKRALATAALLGAMLMVVAGSFGWMTRDRAVQRGRTVDAVAALLDQCEDALRADRADRAAVALDAAERRAADGGANDQTDRLARCRADLGLLRGLDDVDIFRWTWSGSSQPDRAEVVARWRAVLAEHGLTPDADRPEAVAAQINRSPIRDRVLTALDWWSAAERSAGLRAVLKAADPDPYRDAVRDAVDADDRRAVAALAGQPEALAQPARFAAVLGYLGGYSDARARVILESAHQARPGDLTLLMTLGKSYPSNRPDGAGERARWYQAALAVQPGNSAVRNSLGIALLDQGKPDAALVQFREAVRLNPTNAFVRTNLGNALTAKGDLDAALVEHREAVRLDPTDGNARNSLGGTLWKKGDMAAAVAELREAIRLEPDNAHAHTNLGHALMDSDPAAAACAYWEAIRLEPAGANAHSSLGLVLGLLGDLDGGLAELREAVRLEPRYGGWRMNLGNALARKGQQDAAIAELRLGTWLDPDNAAFQVNLGSALVKKKDTDGAVAAFREAVRLDPANANAHHELGKALYQKKDLTGAIAAYREAIRLKPKNPRSWRRLGLALDKKGDMVGAVAALREAVRLNPTDATTRTDLGVALSDEGRGDLDAAIAEYQAAIRLDPTYARAHGNLGSALFEREDWKGAVAALREAARLDPTDADYRSHLGGALFKTGDVDGALVQLREAVRLDPKDASARSNLGAVLCDGKRDYPGAIAAFREAIRLDPTDGTAHFNLGNALRHHQDLPAAVAAYRAAARLEPTAGHFNDLAWLLATGPAGVRDGKQAVADAIRACELTKWKNPGYIDTLAAAHAAAGDFDKAVEYQQKTLTFRTFATKHGTEARERLALYERKTAYRDPAHAPREPGPPPRAVKP